VDELWTPSPNDLGPDLFEDPDYDCLDEWSFDYAVASLRCEVDVLEEAAMTASTTREFMDWLGNEGFDRRDETFGIDWGVFGAVAALAAAHCLPLWSCRGAPDNPDEPYPQIMFAAGGARAELLLTAMEATGIRLEVSQQGFGYASGASIVEFNLLAQHVIAAAADFDRLPRLR
jgi:hypothetical protein